MSYTIVDMADFIGSDKNVAAIVSAKLGKVAGYITGSGGVMWTDSEWDLFPTDKTAHVHIDQSNGLALLGEGKADVGDVENGAGTIQHFGTAVAQRVKLNMSTTLYCSASNVNAYHTYLSQIKVIDHVRWWIADWSLSREAAAAKITGDATNSIVAIQWASPTTNPNTLVPGLNLTLKASNVDLSVARSDWHPLTVPAKPPVPQIKSGLLILSDLSSHKVTSSDGKSWIMS